MCLTTYFLISGLSFKQVRLTFLKLFSILMIRLCMRTFQSGSNFKEAQAVLVGLINHSIRQLPIVEHGFGAMGDAFEFGPCDNNLFHFVSQSLDFYVIL